MVVMVLGLNVADGRGGVHVVPKVHLICDSIGLGGRKRYDELARVVF